MQSRHFAAPVSIARDFDCRVLCAFPSPRFVWQKGYWSRNFIVSRVARLIDKKICRVANCKCGEKLERFLLCWRKKSLGILREVFAETSLREVTVFVKDTMEKKKSVYMYCSIHVFRWKLIKLKLTQSELNVRKSQNRSDNICCGIKIADFFYWLLRFIIPVLIFRPECNNFITALGPSFYERAHAVSFFLPDKRKLASTHTSKFLSPVYKSIRLRSNHTPWLVICTFQTPLLECQWLRPVASQTTLPDISGLQCN